MADHAIDVFIQSKVDDWVRHLQRIIQIPSVFENEHAVVDFVQSRLDGLGIQTTHIPFSLEALEKLSAAQPPFSTIPGRRNLVARLPGRGGGRTLVLNCHLDIVPVVDPEKWTFPPFGGQISDGFIYGRGAYDDKAGVTLCLALLECLTSLESKRRGDVIVHFVLEDECTGNGTLLCLEAGHVGDGAIIIDGTRLNNGISQHAGNCQFTISVKGRPASVSVSHMGINAAEMMAALLLDLRTEVASWNKANTAPWTRFPSPNQFVTQSIISSATQLTVPTLAEAQAYITFTPHLTLAQAQDKIERTAQDFATRAGLPEAPVFNWTGYATEPVFSDSDDLISEINRANRRHGGADIDFGPSTGTSDMRHFIDKGIPCVLYGPGMGYNPHRVDERYEISSIPVILKTLYSTVEGWCA